MFFCFFLVGFFLAGNDRLLLGFLLCFFFEGLGFWAPLFFGGAWLVFWFSV